ncbi:MAG: hypothetical protein KatS3mg007_2037 [Thermoanaerobaculum sp.]|nr:MAG: hypothetical protein KatS3mg007_2037 [Thermoanaerobaculum sp.]
MELTQPFQRVLVKASAWVGETHEETARRCLECLVIARGYA